MDHHPCLPVSVLLPHVCHTLYAFPHLIIPKQKKNVTSCMFTYTHIEFYITHIKLHVLSTTAYINRHRKNN